MGERMATYPVLLALMTGGLLSMSCGQLAFATSPPGVYKGSGSSSICTGDREVCGSFLNRPVVNGEVYWQAGILVGEPVVNMGVAWRPNSLANHVAPVYAKADPMLGLNPEGEAAQQLRLYNVKTRLTVTYGNATYTMDQDAGVPDVAGKKVSYNVPGSPDWSRLFRNANGDFIPAEQAKEIFRSNAMSGARASIVSANVDTSKFEQWWLDKNVDRYAAPLRQAIDARLAALGETFGMPADDIRAEIAALKATGNGQALIGKLEGILQKLSPDQIPAKFLGEGPERLMRLKRYADAIAPNEAALREATKNLPPMPGTSERYDTWYEQVEVRLNRDEARHARLREMKEEADRLELQAAQAELRAQERAKARAEKLRRREEAKQRREDEERRRRVESYASSEAFSWGGSTTSSFESSGWGYDSYRFNPSYWTADGYLSSSIREGSSFCQTEEDLKKEPGERWSRC